MLVTRRWTRTLALLLLTVLTQGAGTVLFAQGRQDYIVRFRDGTSAALRATAVRSAGAALGFNFTRVNAAAVKVPNANALAALQNHPSVLAVIPDRPVFAYQNGKAKPGTGGGGAPVDDVIPAGVVRVGAPTGTSNGEGVGVAVLDTGVDLAHRDLAVAGPAFNAFAEGLSCQDDQGHGTHVAGTIAARDNGVDVVGVAPKAQIYCVKVLDSTGSGSDATVMAGLEWVLNNHDAVNPNIKVVNMSLGRAGSADDNPLLHGVVTALEEAGITVVVAAGNDPSLEVSDQIPAGYPEVIAVASTTAQGGTNQCRLLSSPIRADTASYFTSDGVAFTTDADSVTVFGLTVSAPGEEKEDVSRACFIKSIGILSTRLGGATARMSGTSMASPHVAGIVARHYQRDPSYTVDEIRGFLVDDAVLGSEAPRDSPTSSYTFDGEREGIAQAP